MNNSGQDRIDQVDTFYRSVSLADAALHILFWSCAIASILIQIRPPVFFPYQELVLGVGFVILVLLYGVTLFYLRSILLPKAERERCKQLLTDSLGVAMSTFQTKNYYNNNLPPSTTRLGLSLLENSFFGKSVTARMLITERIRALAYFFVWVAILIGAGHELPIVIIVTQIVFSGSVVYRWVNLEIFRHSLSRIFDDLYTLFLSGFDPSKDVDATRLLYILTDYESTKRSAAIKQSTRVFNMLNPSLSKRWENIKECLDVSADQVVQGVVNQPGSHLP